MYAAGGLVILPIAAGIGGYFPPWPRGIVAITSLMELVILIVNFQLMHKASRKLTSILVVASAICIFLFSGTYMLGSSIFVYNLPDSSVRVTLGCGLSDNAIQILKSQNALPVNDDCPGEFTTLLASAQYEADHIWKKRSVSIINAALAFSWLGAFASLASLFGAFISFQRRT
jgi:hypothetical protein